jgi:hypothetical protein
VVSFDRRSRLSLDEFPAEISLADERPGLIGLAAHQARVRRREPMAFLLAHPSRGDLSKLAISATDHGFALKSLASQGSAER